MARTTRVGKTRDGKAYEAEDRRSYHRTESKWARKETGRTARHAATQALRHDGTDHDDATYPAPRHTGGWLSH